MALGYTCFRVNLSSTTTSWYYNLVGVDRTSVSSYDKLPPAKHSIVLTFKYDGGGIGKGGLATLSVDGKKVAERKLERTIPFRVSADETLDIGEDTGTPVSEDYHVPFKFTGTLNKVVINLGEAALTPQEQKELDQQEGANELID
jgi:arylsulfatase